MSRLITISYELNPPAGIDAGSLSASKTHNFHVKNNSGLKRYYGGLREAIAEARKQTGDELTAWRDAVGKAELSKETKQTLKYEEGEEDEGEDEEQA